jgi:hypothetical protein
MFSLLKKKNIKLTRATQSMAHPLAVKPLKISTVTLTFDLENQ